MISREFGESLLVSLLAGDLKQAGMVIDAESGLSELEVQVLRSQLDSKMSHPEVCVAMAEGLRILGAQWDSINEFRRASFYSGGVPPEYLDSRLFAYFCGNRGGRAFGTWVHHLPVYEKYLSAYVGRPVRLLELGTHAAGRLEMLRYFLGPQAEIISVDLDTAGRRAATDEFPVIQGDLANMDFLDCLVADYGPVDIVIDDASHLMSHQVRTVERLFPALTHGGLYFVEDTQTSYLGEYQDSDASFIDWVKDRIDDIHSHHYSRDTYLSRWATELDHVDLYDGIAVLHHKIRHAPFREASGIGYGLSTPWYVAEALVAETAVRDASQEALVASQEALVASQEALVASQEALVASQEDLQIAAETLTRYEQDVRIVIHSYESSWSWRLTRPLRKFADWKRRRG